MPIGLYRLGLGWLLGHQFLLLTHAGRRTGRVRQTALKVLRYDPETGESVVASAWGPTADWYRNVRARPALAVRTAHDRFVPEQRLLPPAEAFAVFDDVGAAPALVRPADAEPDRRGLGGPGGGAAGPRRPVPVRGVPPATRP